MSHTTCTGGQPAPVAAGGTVGAGDAARAQFCEKVFARAFASETAIRYYNERAAEAGRREARLALSHPYWGGTTESAWLATEREDTTPSTPRRLTWPRRPDPEDIRALAEAMDRAWAAGGEGAALARLLERLGVCRPGEVGDV